MSPLEPVTLSQMQALERLSPFTEIRSAPSSPVRPCSSGIFEGPAKHRAKDCLKEKMSTEDDPRDSDEVSLAPDAQHVLSLNLEPNQVALVKDTTHESAIARIYDHRANEISYKFSGGMDQFKQEYVRDALDEERLARSKTPWGRLHSWGRRMRDGLKKKATRSYEVETWTSIHYKPS